MKNREPWLAIARELCPPILRRMRNDRLYPRTVYEGDFASWEAARAASDGYDAEWILRRVCESLGQVRDGRAAAERDGVLFAEVEHSYPVLAAALRTAMRHEGRLCVLDLGGSLGSSYFASRGFLAPTSDLTWCVVEQPAFVEAGRRLFATDQLRFYETLDDCLVKEPVNFALLSGVLAYLPRPHETLDDLLHHEIETVVLDRTVVLDDARADRLAVQRVHAGVYGRPVSYPAWILEPDGLGAHFSRRYELASRFDALDGKANVRGNRATYRGYIYERAAARRG